MRDWEDEKSKSKGGRRSKSKPQGQEQGKKVRFSEEEQSDETRGQSSDEPDLTSGFAGSENRQRNCRSHPRRRPAEEAKRKERKKGV